jgi:predicted ATPase
MGIQELRVANYRSIRDLRLPFRQINVLVGANGCGKTNLYRSMLLLFAAARGELARMLVEEGGIPSVLWAGPRKRDERARMSLGVTCDSLEYELICGVPKPAGSLFDLDPEIKSETVHFLDGRRRVDLLERGIGSVSARDAEGRRITYPMALSPSESVLSQLREPHRFPQLSALRQELLNWRFYHQFRTDAESPLRQPQIGVRTPVLSHDGRDLAAAFQTIHEIGDPMGLAQAVGRAFPGASLEIQGERAQFSLWLKLREFRRPFDARELSDGTLRYLCLLAALLSPRPPAVLALNEPETSIHPDLLDPLAELIVRASRDSQLWITTHSERLAEGIERLSGVSPVRLEKVSGATRIAGQPVVDLGDFDEDD